MKSAELENLVRVRLLSREAPLPGEIEKALEEADECLQGAREATRKTAQFRMGYDAAYLFARTALRIKHYRPHTRQVVFEALRYTLGVPQQDCNLLCKAHNIRNQISYVGRLLADEIEETPDLPKQVCDLAQRIGPLVADMAEQNQWPSQASTADPAPS